MARGSKVELTQAQVDAIVLPHGGERKGDRGERLMDRSPYWWNGMRGRACCVHVFSGDRSDMLGHRCGKIAAVTETVDGKVLDFCSFHSTPNVAKRVGRQAERDAAQRAKWDAAAEARRMAHLAPGFKAALELIANGDNDPRRTARIALGLETADGEQKVY